MSNYYTHATSDQLVPCSHEEYERLNELLMVDRFDEQECAIIHDFVLGYSSMSGGTECGAHLKSDDCGCATPDLLPPEFLVEFGKLLARNNIEYLTIGLAFSADKLAVGSHGGEYLRIYPNGKLVKPTITWEVPA